MAKNNEDQKVGVFFYVFLATLSIISIFTLNSQTDMFGRPLLLGFYIPQYFGIVVGGILTLIALFREKVGLTPVLYGGVSGFTVGGVSYGVIRYCREIADFLTVPGKKFYSPGDICILGYGAQYGLIILILIILIIWILTKLFPSLWNEPE